MKVSRALLALLAALPFGALALPGPLPAPDLRAHAFANGGQPLSSSPPVIGFGPTGRIYVAGAFTHVDGQARPGLARFHPDGTLDAAWNPALPAAQSPALMVAEDGAGNAAIALARANDEVLVYIPAATLVGAVVATELYWGWTALAFDDLGALYAAKLPQPGGQVCRAGSNRTSTSWTAVVKLNGGTTPAGGFAGALPPVSQYIGHGMYTSVERCVRTLRPIGAHVYAAGHGLRRISATTGATDSAWNAIPDTTPALFVDNINSVRDVIPGAGGMVYAAGSYRAGNVVNLGRFAIASGAADTTWMPSVPSPGRVDALALDSGDNRLYAAGPFSVANDRELGGFAVFSTQAGAALHEPWTPDSPGISRLALLGDRILAAGAFSSAEGAARDGLAGFPLASIPVTWPVVSLSPASLDFGSAIAPTTRDRVLIVTNKGGAQLTLAAPVIGPPSLFAALNGCGPIAPGQSCAMTIRASVDPKAAGGGMAQFQSTAMERTQSAALGYGAGTAFSIQQVSSDTGFYSTPPLLVGEFRTATFRVQAGPNAAVTIEALGAVGARASEFSLTPGCTGLLAASATCNFDVTFTPTTFGDNQSVQLCGSSQVSGTCAFVLFRSAMNATDYDGDGIPNAQDNQPYTAQPDYDNDGIPNALDADPYVKSNDIFADATLFARQQYRDFLGREGDTAGVSHWTQQISSGARTRAQMIEAFFNSAEFQGVGAPVARLYFAYFRRVPDYAGLTYWIGQHRGGASLESISNAFAGSAEFTSLYGSLANGQFVTLVYQNILGRDPDSAGQAYWTGQLDSGALTRGQMMAAFSESAEYRGVIQYHVYVTMIYVGMMRRGPDEAGFAFWVDYMDQGNSGIALIQGFLASAEYRRRFLP